ncbi:carbohydrate-binding protein, partial [Corallococcus sp. AB049A]
MRNRFVFTSSALLLALHAFGCGASPEGDTTNPSGEVSTPAPSPA